MKKLVINLIKTYQKINFFNMPILKALFLTDGSCRYSPTCSEYTLQSVERFGVTRGLFIGLKRIISCHPFSEGGFDPIPQLKKFKN